MINHSIIFYLNENLRVYQLGGNVNGRINEQLAGGVGVNPYSSGEFEKQLELLHSLERQNHTLELTDKFESIWRELDGRGLFEDASKIYYWIGSRAGFTDTRVIFMWLQSWRMFSSEQLIVNSEKLGVEFFVLKLTEALELETLNNQEITGLIKRSEQNVVGELVYSAEPRIGKGK